MLTLLEERVGLLNCRIMNIVMEVGNLPDEEAELEHSINVDFTIINEAETDRPAGVDVLAYFKIDDGAVFSLDISGRAVFDIPEDYSEEDAFEYLAKFGATRAFDCMRPYIEMIAASAGFPMMDIPPVVVNMTQ